MVKKYRIERHTVVCFIVQGERVYGVVLGTRAKRQGRISANPVYRHVARVMQYVTGKEWEVPIDDCTGIGKATPEQLAQARAEANETSRLLAKSRTESEAIAKVLNKAYRELTGLGHSRTPRHVHAWQDGRNRDGILCGFNPRNGSAIVAVYDPSSGSPRIGQSNKGRAKVYGGRRHELSCRFVRPQALVVADAPVRSLTIDEAHRLLAANESNEPHNIGPHAAK